MAETRKSIMDYLCSVALELRRGKPVFDVLDDLEEAIPELRAGYDESQEENALRMSCKPGSNATNV